jgi:hypothetical protein
MGFHKKGGRRNNHGAPGYWFDNDNALFQEV